MTDLPSDRPVDWLEESNLIRPYSLTGGRTRPSRSDLSMTTQVAAVPAVSAPEVDPEAEQILALCVRPVSVAEVASWSGLALGVVRVLLADLADQGHLMVYSPKTDRSRPDAGTLRHVLARIREL
ncbi:DUF742 domain-containing protein [Nocardiopsis sp. LOL_012]|uniref:DUF742 domain-containing protein n=1 Tax=Nocardiopsis sp. LOL_012 TaxID=3345409 RepID=UPI003A870B67